MKAAKAPTAIVYVDHSEEMEMLRWTISKASHLYVELESKAADTGKLPTVAPLRIMLQAQSRLSAFKKEMAQWQAAQQSSDSTPEAAQPVADATPETTVVELVNDATVTSEIKTDTSENQTENQTETVEANSEPKSQFPAYLPELIAEFPGEALIQEIAKRQDRSLSSVEALLRARKILREYLEHYPFAR